MRRRLLGQPSTWTRKATLLLETAIVLFWLGLALQVGRLILASAVILSYLLLSLALTLSPNRAVAFQRRLSSDRALEEQPIQVNLMVENESQETALIHVAESFPEGFEVTEGSTNYAALIGPKSQETISGVMTANFRGHYLLPAPQARASDEFGLRERELGTGKPTYLSVLPPIEDLSDFSLESRTAQPEIGTFRSGNVGVGTEFFGIREYLPGDELRRINWKASARTGSLFSNEYEREHVTNIYLFVDLTPSQIGILKWTVRTAAAIATYLLRTRNRLGLIVLGESTSHVKIESGRRQLLKVLDKLVTAEPGGTGEPSTYLQRLLEEMPRCEVLLVSALASEAISRTAIAVKRKQERIAVITSIPTKQEAAENDLVLRAARLMYSLKRRATIQQIKNAEVRVIQIPSDRPIRTAVSMIRERPIRH